MSYPGTWRSPARPSCDQGIPFAPESHGCLVIFGISSQDAARQVASHALVQSLVAERLDDLLGRAQRSAPRVRDMAG